MNKTKIEWCDYTINPIRGLCPMACSYCYARRMYRRFKLNPEIRYIEPGFYCNDIATIKNPSRIFWCSTFELFHDSIPDLWRKDIIQAVRYFQQHTHIFLTKQTQNLPRRFPDNCWVGASATNWDMAFNALWNFQDVNASVKFISFEPLLDWKSHRELEGWFRKSGISWVILGQQTPTKMSTQPMIEWIREIMEAADTAGVPIFLKNNLKPLLSKYAYNIGAFWSERAIDHPYFASDKLRQEFPVKK
jgi:protein gp37